jgi:hypothetical protein
VKERRRGYLGARAESAQEREGDWNEGRKEKKRKTGEKETLILI